MNALDLAIFRAKTARHIPINIAIRNRIESEIERQYREQIKKLSDEITRLDYENRELESNLQRITQLKTAASIPAEPRPQKFPTLDSIIRSVRLFYRIRTSDLLSHRRTADVMMPRQVGMYLGRTLTLHSYPKIGRVFGGRDHTTSMHAFHKIERLISIDPVLAAEIEELKALILEAAQVAGETA